MAFCPNAHPIRLCCAMWLEEENVFYLSKNSVKSSLVVSIKNNEQEKKESQT
jgi:hypothetical protein